MPETKYLADPDSIFTTDLSTLPEKMNTADEIAQEAVRTLPTSIDPQVTFWGERCRQIHGDLTKLRAAFPQNDDLKQRQHAATIILLASLCESCSKLACVLCEKKNKLAALKRSEHSETGTGNNYDNIFQRIGQLSEQARILLEKLDAIEKASSDSGLDPAQDSIEASFGSDTNPEQNIILTIARAASACGAMLRYVEDLESMGYHENIVSKLVTELGGNTQPRTAGCGCKPGGPGSNRH